MQFGLKVGEIYLKLCHQDLQYLQERAAYFSAHPIHNRHVYVRLVFPSPLRFSFVAFFRAERAETEREKLSKMNSSCHPGWAFFRAGIAISFNCATDSHHPNSRHPFHRAFEPMLPYGLGSGTPLSNTPLATTPLPDRLLIRINYRCVPTYKGSLQNFFAASDPHTRR